MTTAPTRFVDSTDGVRIAVYEEGNPDGPPLVLVHGWPDSHALWDGVVSLLADRFRIVRYDNRGVRPTTAPRPASAYTMERYADDLAAVLAACCPGQRAHVLGHDWGSIGVWEYLGRPDAGERVASFTSVSGPSAHHAMLYVRGGLARPWRPVKFARAVSQLARLAYMALFSVPVLPGLAVRAFGGPFIASSTAANAAGSIKVYRANALPALLHPRRDHHVDTPVQLIVNTADPFIRPHAFADLGQWVPRLWRRDLKSGHWAPLSHPQVLARAVAEFADHIDGQPAGRELRRAEVGRARQPFSDTLVSITGAGSGIGRETALAFARQGAELVLSDIDEGGLKDTAATVTARGGTAHTYVLDVSDAAAVERFADEICAAHGVPDIVVNNAGVGQAGGFLDTPADQWDRVLDVNLGGVVNGCRAFARRLVERGTGGHIVNVASMAAYTPIQSLNAYCTSKAAVYMFSDCLRAELDAAGVGLTTICPGVIDTPIVRHTRIHAPAGRSGDVAARRAQLEKLFALRRYGPDKVAKSIIAAVQANRAIQPVAPEAHVVYGVSRVAPQVLRSTARARVL